MTVVMVEAKRALSERGLELDDLGAVECGIETVEALVGLAAVIGSRVDPDGPPARSMATAAAHILAALYEQRTSLKTPPALVPVDGQVRPVAL